MILKLSICLCLNCISLAFLCSMHNTTKLVVLNNNDDQQNFNRNIRLQTSSTARGHGQQTFGLSQFIYPIPQVTTQQHSPTGRLTALNSPLALDFAHALCLQRLMSVNPNSGIWPSQSTNAHFLDYTCIIQTILESKWMMLLL